MMLREREREREYLEVPVDRTLDFNKTGFDWLLHAEDRGIPRASRRRDESTGKRGENGQTGVSAALLSLIHRVSPLQLRR